MFEYSQNCDELTPTKQGATRQHGEAPYNSTALMGVSTGINHQALADSALEDGAISGNLTPKKSQDLNQYAEQPKKVLGLQNAIKSSRVSCGSLTKKIRAKCTRKNGDQVPHKKILMGQPVSIGDNNELQVFLCDKTSNERRFDSKLNFIA